MLTGDIDTRLPPLAWVASIRPGRRSIAVRRGAHTEAGDRWVCEAAWSGAYERGGFDRTPLVFGSGIRVRSDGIRFVSAGTTVDRLWIWRDGAGEPRRVSNSLVQLLAEVGARLLPGYERYEADLESIVEGLDGYRRTIPVDEGRLEVVYFENLVWDGRRLARVPKPELEREFSSFEAYRSFLGETARALLDNVSSPGRDHPVELLTSISSGYDSPAASVMAREIGCREAVTLRQARSPTPGRTDTGRTIGETLGLDVSVYERDLAIGPAELRYWAADGKPQDVNLGIFDYPGPVCLFFTGFHGDKVWTTKKHDTSDRIVRGDTSGLGFTEDRLHRGVLHCPVPYWGVRKMDEIERISQSSEMAPWRLWNDYDRPIPRRIVEQAGVPRDAFGQRKLVTTSEKRTLPYTRELLHDFVTYAEGHGESVSHVSLRSLQARLQWYLDSFEMKWPVLRGRLPSVEPDVPALQCQWAVDRLIGSLGSDPRSG